MSDGIGCQCYARCSSECGCENVDWTPREVIELRNQLSHLQKLCEEQKGLMETLQLALDGANHSKNLLHAHVEEQRGEIADRADTERSMAQAMLEDGEKIKELESQLAEKERELKNEKETTKLYFDGLNFAIEDVNKYSNQVDELKSQIATQTERVKELTELLKCIQWGDGQYHCQVCDGYDPDHEEGCVVGQALKQESLGDGK